MATEHVLFLTQVSTIMKALINKDDDLVSHFDNFFGVNTLEDFNSTPFKQMLIDNHTKPAKNGKIAGHLPLEHILGFCKKFKKITKNLALHLTLKTNDLRNIVFITIDTDINVIFKNLYFFVPVFLPNTDAQVMFNESIKNNYTIIYDSGIQNAKYQTNSNELQVDIGSAQHFNSAKYLNGSFQTADRIAAPKKKNNIEIFDNVNVRN